MYRDYELQRVNRCPIDIYVASNMPYPYPYKLGKPEHVSERIRESSTTFIMDSGIKDETTNAEVLQLADIHDADFVIPCDELHDQEATTDAIMEFLELYDNSDLRATPLIPLQPPYDEHYKELPDHPAYCLGGIAFDYSGREQVEELQRFRREAGPKPYAHALGVGGSMDVVRVVGNNPNLIQSVDCSTPEQAAINSSVIDAQMTQKDMQIKTGSGSSAGRYMLAQQNAYQINDAYTVATNETQGLGAYQ